MSTTAPLVSSRPPALPAVPVRASARTCGSRPTAWLGSAALLLAVGCGPKAPPPKPPQPASEPVAEAPAEPEAPSEPPPKVPEDAFSIGSFNLDWAYDALGDRRPKQSLPHLAPDEEAWEWKRDRIVEVLAAEKLDIVVLSELGGERELGDIVMRVPDKGGPSYQYAWVKAEDKASGKQSAILSRFPISNERRTDAYAPIHVAADIELPTGDVITVIALQLREGSAKSSVSKRLEMAKSLKRRALKEQKSRPVIVVGTVGDPTLPFDEGYEQSAAGVLSGKSTKKDSDDCDDSAAESLAQRVSIGRGEAIDRIFTCGLVMRGAETSGRELIVREEEDAEDTPWPSVPVAEAPHRDVSDQLVVWAEVALPKKPEPEGGEAAAEDGGGSE